LSKLPIFNWFFSQGDVLMTVNTHSDGVSVPSHVRQQEIVDFIVGVKPTPKLVAGDEGVTASMKFSGAIHECHFPWSSIVQMSVQDAVIQFRNPAAFNTKFEPTQPQESQARKKRGNLRIVK